MGVVKSDKQALWEERRKNEMLEALLAKEREKVQFLGLLAADIDIDELMSDDTEEVDENGEA